MDLGARLAGARQFRFGSSASPTAQPSIRASMSMDIVAGQCGGICVSGKQDEDGLFPGSSHSDTLCINDGAGRRHRIIADVSLGCVLRQILGCVLYWSWSAGLVVLVALQEKGRQLNKQWISRALSAGIVVWCGPIW